jgi:hypothetical protein
MPGIKLTAFIGEQPNIIPTLLPANAARSAVNVRLDDGGLTPIRAPIGEAQLDADDQETIYRHGEAWLSWSAPVHAVPGPVATDRLYYTGDGVPKMKVGDVVYELAVPRPEDVPTAIISGSGSGDVVTRTYVYTFVTSFGEESEPSPATAPVDWQPGEDVVIGNIEDAPADRAVTKQRFYRSQTGQSGTYFYFIAERDVSDADFTDDVAVDAFAEPLPSEHWNTPPDDLAGLVAMPNGMMAAFRGREVCFAEPFHPHAWPERYRFTVDADIVGLGAIGNGLVITTKGNPYFAVGTHPSTMQSSKMEQGFPCINGRSIVDLGFAICYASHEGLVAVDGAGASRLVTRELFNSPAWLRLSPATMLGGQLSGRYVAFYQTTDLNGSALEGAIFVDIGAAPFLLRSDAVAAAVHYDRENGALFYLVPGTRDVVRLDAPDGPNAQMYWRSKTFRFLKPQNFGCILVHSSAQLGGQEAANLQAAIDAIIEANQELIDDGPLGGELNGAVINGYPVNGDSLTELPDLAGVLTVGVYADGTRVAQIRTTNRVERLPSGFLAEDWEIDVAGDISVTQITMAKTIDELKSVPGN